MRSGAGVFWPRSRRLECLVDFFPRDLPAEEAAGFAELRVAFPGVEGADHAVPAVSTSARPAVIDFRSLMQPRLSIISAARDSAIELSLVLRWYHAGQEHRHGAIAISAAQDLEHYVRSGLELSHGALVVVHGSDRFAIDLRDDVAAAEAEVVSEARGIDIRDQHTALALHAYAHGAFWGEAIDAKTELGWRGFALLVTQAARLRREDVRAVFDDGSRFLLGPVTDVAQFDLAANRRLRNRIHEV